MTSPVETAPLRPSGRRGPDRALPVAALIVAFITIALAKPWEAAPFGGEQERSRPSPGAGEVESDALSLAGNVPVRALSWDRLAKLAPPRDGWGVRAILARPLVAAGRPAAGDHEAVASGWAFSERWASVSLSPTAPASRAMSPYRSKILGGVLSLDAGAATVAAIGITSPFADTPLDVRIWRVPVGQVPERLRMREVPGEAPGVERLFLAPAGPSSRGRAWAPGAYRIDMLLGSRLGRIILLVTGSTAVSPETSVGSSPRPPLTEPEEAIQKLPPGPFVLDAEAGLIHLPGVGGRGLDEAGAWLAGRGPGQVGAVAGGAPGQAAPVAGGAPGPAGPVASGAFAHPLALGLRLGPGEQFVSATLTRLAPSPGPVVGPVRVGPATSRSRPPTRSRAEPGAYSVFEAPSGGWPLGVYRIDAELRRGSRKRRASWHVDLLPRGGRSFAPLLAAARAMGSWAGRRAFLAATVFPNGPNRFALIQSGSPRGAAQRPTIRPPVRCVGPPILSHHRLLALGHDRLVAPEVELAVVSRTGQRFGVPVAVAPDVTDGLALVAPVSGGNWLPGTYELSLTYRGAPRGPDPVDRYLFCVRPASVAVTRSTAASRWPPGPSRVRRR